MVWGEKTTPRAEIAIRISSGRQQRVHERRLRGLAGAPGSGPRARGVRGRRGASPRRRRRHATGGWVATGNLGPTPAWSPRPLRSSPRRAGPTMVGGRLAMPWPPGSVVASPRAAWAASQATRGLDPHVGQLAAALVRAGAARRGRSARLLEVRPGLEQLRLGDHGVLAPVVGQVVAGPEGDRLGGAGLGAVAAVDAAHQVDLVALGVPLARGDGVVLGVLGGPHVDAADRAGGGAELAADALLQAVVVAVEDVAAAVARRHRLLLLGPLHRDRLLEHGAEGQAHPLGDLAEHQPALRATMVPVIMMLTRPSGSSIFQPRFMSRS